MHRNSHPIAQTILRYLAIGGLAGLGCASAETISLVTDPWCPYACQPDSDRPGYMIELAKAVFEPMGHSVEYRIMPFARAVTEVEQGKAFGLVGEQQVPERAGLIFPKVEQGQAKACFYTSQTSPWRYTDQASLKKQRIGTINTYVYGAELDTALAAAGPVVSTGYGDQALINNVKKLEAKRLDAIVEYEAVIAYKMKTESGFNKLRQAGCAKQASNIYIPFSPIAPNAGSYAQALADGMKTLRQNGKLAAILARYGLRDWQSPGATAGR